MIELATTPTMAPVQGPHPGGAGMARDNAAGFSDLVARQGSGRQGPARESDALTIADDDAARGKTGDADKADPDERDETAGDDGRAWPGRSLHEVLATLLGDRDAVPAEGSSPDAPAELGTEAPADATSKANDMVEDLPDTGAGDQMEETGAGDVAAAAAIILPAQPRDHRQASAGSTRPAETPAPTTFAPPRTETHDEAAGQKDGDRSGKDRRGEAPTQADGGRKPVPEAGDLKVRVVTETATPAPGVSQNQRTVAELAATIARDGEWTSAVERATASRTEAASAPIGPVRDLRIQLNPAELGTVEARLRIAGEQLSVEIRVENGEAFRRLSAEKDAIISALRGLGFAVDDISIQQQTPTSGQAQTGAGNRPGDTSGGLSQGAGRDQHGEGEAAGGHKRGGEQGAQNGDAHTPATRPAGGGLYI